MKKNESYATTTKMKESIVNNQEITQVSSRIEKLEHMYIDIIELMDIILKLVNKK